MTGALHHLKKAKRRRAEGDEGNRGGALPKIILSGRQPDAIVDDAIGALVAANDPPELFVRADRKSTRLNSSHRL